MPDYREELLNKTLLMLDEAGIQELDTIRTVLIRAIGDYEISERCTEVAVLGDCNDQIIKMFLATKRIEGGSDETAKSRWYIIRKFSDDINKPFDKITAFDILHWLADEQKSLKLSSVDNYRNMLAAMFSWMQSTGIISDNPMKNIKSIKHSDPIKTSFNPVEIDALRSACKKDIERVILELLLTSGVRCEEMCSLKWDDINFVTKDIYVIEGKGRKSRITLMDDVARKYLLKYRSDLKYQSEYVFPVLYGEKIKPRTKNSVWRILKELAARAKVENVHPHRFRRTCATILYKRGLDIRMIQKLLGHSSINTTMIYIDTDVELLRDAYKRCVS